MSNLHTLNQILIDGKVQLQAKCDALQAELSSLKVMYDRTSEAARDLGNERDTLQARINELEQGEPVAWMHEERVDVIHKDVKALIAHFDTDYMHRPIHKAVRYTIPLYTHPSKTQPLTHDARRYQILRDAKYQHHEDDISVSDSCFNVLFGAELDQAVDALEARHIAIEAAHGIGSQQ